MRKVCEAGNRVVFDEEGSYVENKKTGEGAELVKEKGSYIRTVWIPSHRNQSKGSNRNFLPQQGFRAA